MRNVILKFLIGFFCVSCLSFLSTCYQYGDNESPLTGEQNNADPGQQNDEIALTKSIPSNCDPVFPTEERTRPETVVGDWVPIQNTYCERRQITTYEIHEQKYKCCAYGNCSYHWLETYRHITDVKPEERCNPPIPGTLYRTPCDIPVPCGQTKPSCCL
jgi:hypothetical protein